MNVTPIRTPIVSAGSTSLVELLDKTLLHFAENSILVVTSKVVSLCEGRVVNSGETTRDELIAREAQYYLPPTYSRYGHHFTITENTLIASAGIDESNAGGPMVLWPRDAQATANEIRRYLEQRFGVVYTGVLIVDSTSQPMRRGSFGISLAHSGFKELHDYRGQPDLFGKPMKVSVANVSSGLAAAAVVTMGEGDESTPLAILTDVPFVTFTGADPSTAELQELQMTMQEDLFAPFFVGVKWERGRAGQ